MQTSHRIGPVVVMGALLVGIVALKASMPLSWVGSVAGLTILLTLFSFDEQGRRPFLQSMAFGLACGLGLMLAAGGVVNVIRGNGDAKFDPLGDGILSLIWGGAAVLFVMLDRIRMSNRVDETEADGPKTVIRAQSTSLSGYTSLGSVSPASAPAPAYYQPPAPAPRPAPPQPSYPQPSYQQPAPAPPAPVAPPPPAYEPPPPAPVPVQAAPEPQYAPPPPQYAPPQPPAAPPQYAPPQPQYAPPPAPPPVQTWAPPPPPPKQGKEAMIYVGMVDQGLNVLRSVRAVEVGKNYFQIVEEQPPNESWQFTTGQVVKCEKKNLSTGKGWVAVEEAPRR